MDRLRTMQISFNPENVVCLTERTIPLSVKFTVSLGPKFGFVNFPGDLLNLEDFNVAFDKILDECNQFDQWFMLRKDMEELREEIKFGSVMEFSKAQKFIRQQADLAAMFLKANKVIVVAPADKGGKIIIMDKNVYETKIDEHLKKNLEDHTYYHWKGATIDDCREILEPKFERVRTSLNSFLLEDARNGFDTCSIGSEPYMIAKLFVKLKSHKDGIRPIISAPDAWGGQLSDWILKKLGLILNLFGKVKVIGSEEFVKKIKEIRVLPESHKLTNWDYVSMFTNIPFNLTKKIIAEYYGVVAKVTCVPAEFFIEIVALLVEDSSYFTYKTEVYRQAKGLPMGNRLSKMLAEIMTNYLTLKGLDSMKKEDCTFLYKFVDDLAGALDPKSFAMFEKAITGNVKHLEVERTDESGDGSVTFLDTIVFKDRENGVLTRWWQKECSVRQILNYHSAHPRCVKRNVVREYIRHALAVTSPILFNVTINNLRKVLRRSSYPFGFIQDILVDVLEEIGCLSEVSTVGVYDKSFDFATEIAMRSKIISDSEMRSRRLRSSPLRFISFPFDNNNIYKKTKDLIIKRKVNCRLAPRVVRSNKDWIFSKMKDKATLTDVKFGIFSLVCGDCGFKRFYRTNNLDLARSIDHVLLTSETSRHIQEYPDHAILKLPEDVLRYKNSTDLKFAFQRIVKNFQANMEI